MSAQVIVPTHNGYGWTSEEPNQITREWLRFLERGCERPLRALDIGAGWGVATIPGLQTRATIIANDLDKVHLQAIHDKAVELGLEDRLETVAGRFPFDFPFAELDAIHCSNMLHFLRGEEIVLGARLMHKWLRRGGQVFIQVGTIFAGHITRLLPIFEQRRRNGILWAGETDQAKEYVMNEFSDATPAFMNYLDAPPLISAFEAAGFRTERAHYYTRTGCPKPFICDGREHFGIILEK
jgi:2-polyprenyl-3-methyl-5-hydroxy-6-metoxy-1,4-benzoquinol methylase